MGSGFWADLGRLAGTRREFCARVEGVRGLGELVEAELEERGQLACVCELELQLVSVLGASGSSTARRLVSIWSEDDECFSTTAYRRG